MKNTCSSMKHYCKYVLHVFILNTHTNTPKLRLRHQHTHIASGSLQKENTTFTYNHIIYISVFLSVSVLLIYEKKLANPSLCLYCYKAGLTGFYVWAVLMIDSAPPDRNGSDIGAGPRLQELILGYLMSGTTERQMDPLHCCQEVFWY